LQIIAEGITHTHSSACSSTTNCRGVMLLVSETKLKFPATQRHHCECARSFKSSVSLWTSYILQQHFRRNYCPPQQWPAS